MERVARGQPTAAIARSLLVSPATVESHIRAAMRRTGARTRVQAAALSAIEASPDSVVDIVVERDPLEGSLRIRRGARGEPDDGPNLHSLPESPWWLGPGQVVRGPIVDESDLTQVVLAIVRGASVDVVVPPSSSSLVASLFDALGRLGLDLTVAERAATVNLDEGDIRLLLLLGGERRSTRRVVSSGCRAAPRNGDSRRLGAGSACRRTARRSVSSPPPPTCLLAPDRHRAPAETGDRRPERAVPWECRRRRRREGAHGSPSRRERRGGRSRAGAAVGRST